MSDVGLAILRRFDGLARVAQVRAPGMVALKGDLTDARLAAALGAVPGVRTWVDTSAGRVLWMAPDEVLVMAPDAGAGLAHLRGALAGVHATLADVSDLRVMFTISGAQGRDVLAKLMPVDFSNLSPGTLRRSRLAQTAALVWVDEGQMGVLTARSVADYAWGVLTMAARPGGAVGLYR